MTLMMSPENEPASMASCAVRGIDASSLIEVERRGARFSAGGQPVDMLAFAASAGANLLRLRLWDQPRNEAGEGYLGGGNDLGTALSLASRADELGMEVMVDFHYSDFWTDPRKQQLPRRWRGLPYEALREEIRRYTGDCLGAFKDRGIEPTRVQVGNEITNGFVWPHGLLPLYDDERRARMASEDEIDEAFDRLVPLLAAGVSAVGEVLPEACTLVHLDQGGHGVMHTQWFDAAIARGLEFDEIGLSFYPFWHGSLDMLRRNLEALSQRYGKGLIVAETSYGHAPRRGGDTAAVFTEELADIAGFPATPEGQLQYLSSLREVMESVPRGLGFIYWEPAWLAVPGTSWASRAGMAYADDFAEPGASWSNQALFDAQGRALPAWSAFRP